MSYFIARLSRAQQGVSSRSDQVLIRAIDEAGALQVLKELEDRLNREQAGSRVDETASQQDVLFSQPLLLPVSKQTYLEMKRVLPACSQQGLSTEDDDARTLACKRLRPLAQVVSNVLARDAAVSVSVELLEQSLFEATRRPECANIFARPLPDGHSDVSSLQLEDYRFGPRIYASFHAQLEDGGQAIETGDGFEQDVTAAVLSLDYSRLALLQDGTADAEALVVHHHSGPGKVQVVDRICAYFGVAKPSEISREMVESARIRASIDPSRLKVEILTPRLDVFRLGDNPYTLEELQATDWAVDCVVPVPAHSTYNDSVLERAISKVVTGSETALTDIQYRAADESYGPDYAALHVTGRVTQPDRHFELGIDAATPEVREMRLFLNTLSTSDVFQMTTSRSTYRYHILAADQAKLHHLIKPGVTHEALERMGLIADCAVEYELAEDNQDAPQTGSEAEGFFSLPELFSARHEDDNTWTLKLNTEEVNLCFF